jgi:hypothetical protein
MNPAHAYFYMSGKVTDRYCFKRYDLGQEGDSNDKSVWLAFSPQYHKKGGGEGSKDLACKGCRRMNVVEILCTRV